MLKKRKQILIISSLAVVVLIAIFVSGVTRRKAEAIPVTTTKTTQTQTTAVETMVMKPTPFDRTILATGTVLANEEIDLMNEVPGRIVALNFSEGRPVQRGALLVKINDADLQAQKQKIELSIQLAQHDETRAKLLVDQKLTSPADYDAVENKLLSAKADLANVNAAIAKTEIRAPFTGIVGLRSVSPGSNIPASTSIARLQQVDPVKVEFTVPEKYEKEIKVGTPIEYTVEGSSRTYTGTVYAMEPKVNLDTRTITVRALSHNSDRSLVPGNFAKITITLTSQPNALAVPTFALMPEQTGQRVFILRDGIAHAQEVEVGIRTDSTIQITNGLSPGDTIITTGALQLHDGSRVKALPPAAAAPEVSAAIATPVAN